MWRERIKTDLPDFIVDVLPHTQGSEPKEDDDLNLCIKEHGLNYEFRQSKNKFAASASTSTVTSAWNNCKRNGGGSGATVVIEQSTGPPAKKQLMASNAGTTGAGGRS